MTEFERSQKRLRRVLEFQFKATGVTVDDKLREYVARKLRELFKKVPRPEREAVRFAVSLTQKRPATGPESNCKITLTLAHGTLAATGVTPHHYAAVDIAADQMSQELSTYKNANYPRRLRRLEKS